MKRVLVLTLLVLAVSVAFAARPAPKPPARPFDPIPACLEGGAYEDPGVCPPPPVEPVPY